MFLGSTWYYPQERKLFAEGHAFQSWAIWQEPENLRGLQAACQRALHLYTPSLQLWFKNQQFKFSTKVISSFVPRSTLALSIRSQSENGEKSKHNSMKRASKKRKERREEQRDQENEIIKHHVTEQMCSRELMNIWNCFYSSSWRYKDRGRNQQ